MANEHCQGNKPSNMKGNQNQNHKNKSSNYQTSKHAMHLLEHSHTLGNMQDVMRVLQFQKKNIHLDTLERFHIQKDII